MRTSFDVPDVTRTRASDGERLAHAMSARWATALERNKSGKPTRIDLSELCNQEPCAEELAVQHMRGEPSAELRAKAIEYRKGLNGGCLPLSPEQVRIAVLRACEEAIELRRQRFPITEDIRVLVANIGRSPR